jgi:hypothetical protein
MKTQGSNNTKHDTQVYVVHPHPGATSTKSSSSLLALVNLITTQSSTCTPHRTGDLRAPRQILLPRVDLAQSLLTIRALNTYNTCTQLCKPLTIMHRAFTFDHTDLITSTKPSTLLTLPSYLFILYNIGLNMGKPMGRHPFPITLTQNPKRAPKVGEIP